ncbi:hypothetical protein ACNKHO_02800 [Shigella flexneri]
MKTLLGDRVKEVRLTDRLTDTPAIVTTDADDMSTRMAKLFAAAGQAVPEVKYIFELNPESPTGETRGRYPGGRPVAEWADSAARSRCSPARHAGRS